MSDSDNAAETGIILDDVQIEASALMAERKRFCLFWDVGVGKTYATLSRLSLFSGKKVLILAPATAIENMWKKEADKDWFDVFDKNDVEMHSFEWFAWNKKEEAAGRDGRVRQTVVADNQSKLNHEAYDVIVVDEAHRLATSKNHSRTARLISKLSAKAEYVYCLTGTPAPNGYQNLYPLFKNAGMNPWPDMSYDDFLHYFFKGYDMHLPFGTVYKPTAIRAHLMQEFFNDISPYCMFAQKQRDYDVEPTVEIMVSPTKLPAYRDALRNIVSDASGEKQVVQQIVGFGRAYMLLNGFEYIMNAEGANETHCYFPNPKLPYLLGILKKEFLDRDCVIVCYNFKKDIRDISAMLDENGIAWTDDFTEAKSKTGKFAYLLQLKKGISVNLQDICGTIVYYTFSFSFVDYDQCLGRIDRRGQTRSLRTYRLIFSDSIESGVIVPSIDTKQRVDYTLKSNAAKRIIGKEISENGHQ